VPDLIHFAITSHGLGHLTRAVAVANALHRQAPDVQLAFSTTISEELLRKEMAFPFHYRACSYEPGTAQKNCFELDLQGTRQAYREFFDGHAARLKEEEVFLNEVNCTAVVSDASALAIRAASRRGIPNLVLANFTWDWILEPILTSPEDLKILNALRSDYASGMLHLQYPFGPTSSPLPRALPVPMVSRRAQLSGDEVRAILKLPPSDQDSLRLALVCPGGWEPDAWETIEVKDCSAYRFVFVGDLPVSSPQPGVHLAHDLPPEIRFTDLLAAADIVLTKPGYGMASECVQHTTPMLSIERPEFRETALLLDQLREMGPVGEISLDEFFAGHWKAALDHTLAQKTPWKVQDPHSADKVARLVLQHSTSLSPNPVASSEV